MDGWGIDVIIGGSQKALMIPPGLAYCAISERAWKRMETDEKSALLLRFPQRAQSGGERRIFLYSGDFFVRGVGCGAGLHSSDGQRRSGCRTQSPGRQCRTRGGDDSGWREGAWTEAVYASSPGAALTAINPPAGMDSSAIVKEFRESFSAVVANGQGDMKGKLFRIAHIGYYDYLDTIGILAALEHVLATVTGKPVEYGASVRAAQEVFARSLSENVTVEAGASR